MNILFITLLSLLTLLVIFYFSGILSFYTAVPADINFNGASALIAFDSNGNLKTVPVSNVNTGINTAVSGTGDSLSTDITSNSNNFTNFSTNLYPKLASKADVARAVQQGTQSLATFKDLGSYVKKGQKYKIYNNDNNQILLRWGSNIQTDGKTKETDNYRYFNIND